MSRNIFTTRIQLAAVLILIILEVTLWVLAQGEVFVNPFSVLILIILEVTLWELNIMATNLVEQLS